jgi:hypothetical protein
MAGGLAALSPWLVKNWASTGNPVFPLANQWWNANPREWSPDLTAHWSRGHSPPAGTNTAERIRAFWVHVPGDHAQRFGPALLGLGLLGLLSRPRDRLDAMLAGVLAVQIAVWLFATHLYARFALPMLVPLVILGGRASLGSLTSVRKALIVCALLGGAAWNFVFAAGRHARESAPGLSAAVFYEGRLPAYAYLGVMNETAQDAQTRWLLLGEARPFYLRAACDYFTPFNHNPFFALVAEGRQASELAEWLHRNLYTHIMMHWGEVRRIAGTYRFSPPVSEDHLIAALQTLVDGGWVEPRVLAHPLDPMKRYVTLYRVVPDARHRP